MENPSILPKQYGVEILRSEVGSTLHGISIGNDDRDEMGICIENPEYVIGLEHFEQYLYRSAAARESRHDAPSQPGDLDLVVYSLRKWCRLALKANPSVLLLLFVPDSKLVVSTPLGKELQALAPAFLSRKAAGAFLGYLQAQKARFLRERGTAKIPDRGDKDRKYLAHVLRLGYQGVELLETGRIKLPMLEPQRQMCIQTRLGEINAQEILTVVGRMERELMDLRDSSFLPNEPDVSAVSNFLIQAYEKTWKSHHTPIFESTRRAADGIGRRDEENELHYKEVT